MEAVDFSDTLLPFQTTQPLNPEGGTVNR